MTKNSIYLFLVSNSNALLKVFFFFYIITDYFALITVTKKENISVQNKNQLSTLISQA